MQITACGCISIIICQFNKQRDRDALGSGAGEAKFCVSNYLIGVVESKWLLQWISSRWKFFVPPGETLSFLRHFNQFEKGSNSEIGRGPSWSVYSSPRLK